MTIAILGAGGHAKSIYDILKKKKIYFFDRTKKIFRVGNRSFKVSGSDEIFKTYKKKISKVIVAIGDNNIRKNYYKILKKKNLNFKLLFIQNLTQVLDLKLERAPCSCKEASLIPTV